MTGDNMKLGIIGGLGPMATVYFMEMITDLTKASKDQDHIEMIVVSNPKTPDRTAFILGGSDEDPLPYINDSAEILEKSGADVIAIPCITAHCFHGKLCRNTKVRVLNAVDETVAELQRLGIGKAGIMATEGTVRCEIFQDAFRKHDIEPVVPSNDIQKDIMDLIYKDIKAGEEPSKERFDRIMSYFGDKGAKMVVLGCTELSLLKKTDLNMTGTIDAMEILARAAIRATGYKVKGED